MNINDINKLAGLYFPGEDNNSLEKLSHRPWSPVYNLGLGPKTMPSDSST